MTCTSYLRATSAAAAIAAAMAAMTTPVAARAQTTTPPPPTSEPPAIAPYRAPVLALVQPPPGGGPLTVPQDRPVVVFRFAPGEALDPIDGASFRVAVDGHDRTTQFQVAAGEAWGPLGDATAAGVASAPLAAGAHQVAARVCSSRGACAAVDVTVTAVPAATVEPAAGKSGKASRRARVIDFALQAAKRLLAP